MKGISLSTQRLFNHQSFKKVLAQQSTERAPNYRIASEKHDIFTVRTIKICLSAYDDKRFIFDDGITSLLFGHYKISVKNGENVCFSHLDTQKKSMKGISLSTQRLFNHQSFKKVLAQQSTERAPNYRIASEKHDIFTERTIKICLSAYDDKRFIFDDGITSLPFGHYKIVDDILCVKFWITGT